MFISDQYNGVGNLDGDFWDAMSWYGHCVYNVLDFNDTMSAVRDIDMMLIGL